MQQLLEAADLLAPGGEAAWGGLLNPPKTGEKWGEQTLTMCHMSVQNPCWLMIGGDLYYPTTQWSLGIVIIQVAGESRSNPGFNGMRDFVATAHM